MGVWHMDTDWQATPLENILVDVHLAGGVVPMSLAMLVEIIYPLIERKMDAEMARQFAIELTPSIVQVDGKTVADIVRPIVVSGP